MIDFLLFVVDIWLRVVDIWLRVVDIWLRVVDIWLRVVDIWLRVVDIWLRNPNIWSTRTRYFPITMASKIASISRRIITFITRKHIYNNIGFYSLSQICGQVGGQVGGGGYPRIFS